MTTYGDLTKLSPSGASDSTASQDRLSVTGVAASEKLVTADKAELESLKDKFVKAGRNHGIHPALIAAIASRESRAGKLLKSTNGLGDNGNGYGIMQCDLNTSGLNCKQYAWDSFEHINQLVGEMLVPFIKQVQAKHPDWTKEQQLQGGVAAYNFGVKNVQTLGGIDRGTTGQDYSNDVIARAQHLVKAHGW